MGDSVEAQQTVSFNYRRSRDSHNSGRVDPESIAIRNIIGDLEETFQEVVIDLNEATDRKDLGYYLAALLNLHSATS